VLTRCRALAALPARAVGALAEALQSAVKAQGDAVKALKVRRAWRCALIVVGAKQPRTHFGLGRRRLTTSAALHPALCQ
jgi:hypothetical protein